MRGIDEPRVSAWLVDNVDGLQAPFHFDLIAGGHSNLTYRVVDATDRSVVLRRPPLGHVLATAHDMAREHRIISAVGQTSVPVARALALCSDDAVNEAPFYVMSFVDGVVLDGTHAVEGIDPSVLRTLSFHLIDVLADLHDIDVDAVGLGDLARRDAYVERQIKRWRAQWENSKTRELPVIEEVASRLSAEIPKQQGVSIAHGDYRFGNCLVDLKDSKVNAVLDWELCTLGDPLADVGYIGVYWSDPGEKPRRTNDPTASGHFPSYDELLDRYAARTGRDLSDIWYYRAFAAYRLAVIGEGVLNRYMKGVMANAVDEATIANFRDGTELLADSALDFLRRWH
jgi:aminoglycoside phosphotransferase (APT) family kinase protein